MKGEITSDLENGRLKVDIECASIEDVGTALEAMKASARGVFPEIVFPGDEGFPDEAPAREPKKRKRKASSAKGEPPPDSFDAKVLAVARTHVGPDKTAIADELDSGTGVVAMALKRLKDRGCL